MAIESGKSKRFNIILEKRSLRMKHGDLLIDAGNEVMGILGSGYTEAVYEEAFIHELRLREIPYERQRNIEIIYKGHTVGSRRPDCILYPSWSGSKEEEFLVEMKALKDVKDPHQMQAKVYLASMNMQKGVVLNFNTGTGTPEIFEIERMKEPEKKTVPQSPRRKRRIDIGKALLKSGKAVLSTLGKEFAYYSSDVYSNAIAVELRLLNLDFHSETHSVLYKGHSVTKFDYLYVFPDGEVANIFTYKKEDKVEKQIQELKAHNEIFGIEKGFVLAFPEKEDLDLVVKEV
jgi:GxxExxY protein